jgi:glycosyltransferase involved in cell wall biosynthesis
MFRVGRCLPVTVVSPQPWFPLQAIIRWFRPHFRPRLPSYEVDAGVEIFRPRYLSVPGALKWLDGSMMALGAWRTVRRLKRAGRADIIDAHFGYPDGYAAVLTARRVASPVTITMRGTEVRHSRDPALCRRLRQALQEADRVFSVSGSLREVAVGLGIPAESVTVVGNGVDSTRFRSVDRRTARSALGLPESASVLITVGGLVERKGFHRVIECLPGLVTGGCDVHYLVVGSSGPEGDYSQTLKSMVARLGLGSRVHFLGAQSTEGVVQALSAADVFVLASRNEGWANVLLEAMACGLPVVATDVGGNAEVVCRPELGRIVPFGDRVALAAALRWSLHADCDRTAIRDYATANDWSSRVSLLLEQFDNLHREGPRQQRTDRRRTIADA